MSWGKYRPNFSLSYIVRKIFAVSFKSYIQFGGGEIPDTCGENGLLKQGGQSLISLKL